MWEVMFDWDGRTDFGTSIAFDQELIVVAGGTDTASGGAPLFLWLADDGSTVDARVREPGAAPEIAVRAARHVHKDDAGLVVVGSGDTDVWLARYATSGDLEWETTYATSVPRSSTDANSAATLEDGRIVLFGAADLTAEAPGFLAFFDEATLVDEQFFSGPPLSPPELSNFREIRGTLISGTDVLLVGGAQTIDSHVPWMSRRSLTGRALWDQSLSSPPDLLVDRFTGVAARADGTFAAVAERELSSEELRDAWIGLFAPDGNEIWSNAYVGEYHRNDRVSGVACDLSGNVYVHITLVDDDHPQDLTNEDLVVIKYDATGALQWTDRWSGSGSSPGVQSWDYSAGIAVDAAGFVVITGQSYRGATGYDVVVRKLAP